MIKPVKSLIKAGIRNLSIVFTLFTVSNVIIAADNTENSESKRLFESACTQCHGLQMIEKTRDGRSGWEANVHKMVIAGTQLNADEMELVIDYLVQHYGPRGEPMKTGVLPPDAPYQADTAVTSDEISLPAGEGSTLVQAHCGIRCHDLGRVVASRRSADDWRQYTNNMLERGEVTMTAEKIENIVAYLDLHYGTSDHLQESK